MLEVPADMLGWMLGACFAGVLAVAAGALGLYLIARAEGRGILTVRATTAHSGGAAQH
jgi:hypothetical protein